MSINRILHINTPPYITPLAGCGLLPAVNLTYYTL